MKKRKHRFWTYAFAAFVAGSVLWIAFAPPPRLPHHKPLTVEVAPLPETVAPQPKGDELAQPEAHTKPDEAASPAPPTVPPARKIDPPQIAIVIDDMGLDISGSHRAVDLPSYITLSYIPYAMRLHEQTKEAREAGHELLLHMPMEPMGSADPGPGALLVDLPADELRRRLDTALASFVGFDGVNNHMGSKFTSNREDMELVIGELQQRNLFFLDSKTSAQSVGYNVAAEHRLPAIARDVFLDDDMSEKSVRAQLEDTERVARRKGTAVAIGHPHAVTLQALEEWLPDAEKRGFQFVPLNHLVNQR